MNPDAENLPTQSSKFGRVVREWVKVILVAIVISVPIRYFIAEPFIVDGASMDPTFSTGQFLIVDRLSYRFESPQRGDVVIFQYPNNPKIYYIKRVIALPGETIDIQAGKVTITTVTNGTDDPQMIPLDETYVAADHESLDDFHQTMGPTDYFVMGDNRTQSSDSRVWGALDKKFIVGRPFIRLIPFNTIALFPGEHH